MLDNASFPIRIERSSHEIHRKTKQFDRSRPRIGVSTRSGALLLPLEEERLVPAVRSEETMRSGLKEMIWLREP